ncbi:hypothetical protein E4U61_001282 [Claviceps capensis]|nr:hypothetical protein E4U61_001282 [Claviceps capensis]
MPKKDYGELTRISERIGAQPLERSIKHEEVENAALSTSLLESSPASPKPEAPVTSISLIKIVVTPKPPQDTEQINHRTIPSPAPETNMPTTDNKTATTTPTEVRAQPARNNHRPPGPAGPDGSTGAGRTRNAANLPAAIRSSRRKPASKRRTGHRGADRARSDQKETRHCFT